MQGICRTSATTSFRPLVLSAVDRGEDIEVRVTTPIDGRDLPTILFSHSFGSSMDSYGPLTDTWAAHGFAVLQPTHLDSTSLRIAPTDLRTLDIWRHRIADLRRLIDELETIEAAVPG